MPNLPTGPKGATQGSFTGSKEHNNHLQGRSGGKAPEKPGPAAGRSGSPNPVKSGGINRATKSNG